MLNCSSIILQVATEIDCETECILFNLCSLVLVCISAACLVRSLPVLMSFHPCIYLPVFAFDSSVCVCVSCIVHHARPLRHRRLVPQAIPETPFCAARIGHIQSVVILAWSLFRIERVQYCISTVD